VPTLMVLTVNVAVVAIGFVLTGIWPTGLVS
jgi:hypothetical protein